MAGDSEPSVQARVAAKRSEHRHHSLTAAAISGRGDNAPRLVEQQQLRDAKRRRQPGAQRVVDVDCDTEPAHQPTKLPTLHRPPGALSVPRPRPSRGRVQRRTKRRRTKHPERVVALAWCDQRGLGRPQDITRPILDRYARYLYRYRNARTNKPLAPRSQGDRLVAVRAFFKWLTKQYILLSNPAGELELPKVPKSLPRHVLSIAEVESVLSVPDTSKALGIRDRAIMEVLSPASVAES